MSESSLTWTFDVRCSSFSVNLPQFSQRKTKLVLTGSYTGVLSQLYPARVGLAIELCDPGRAGSNIVISAPPPG